MYIVIFLFNVKSLFFDSQARLTIMNLSKSRLWVKRKMWALSLWTGQRF